MAQDTEKYPKVVSFADETPKKGFCTIQLIVPELEVKKAFMKKAEPKNATISVSLETGSIGVKTAITAKEGAIVHYGYKKNLPEDIDAEKSFYEVDKGKILVKLFKAEPVSWTQHAKYFMTPE